MTSVKKSSPSTTSTGEATIAVRLQPRARRNEVVGVRDGVLVARVTAPALQGRANQALRTLIAARLGIGQRQVSIVRGMRSREKLVRIAGLDHAQVKTLLGLPA
jgi:uncharacterized protein (TIGR00251 family)